jgi:hypothetical protein
MTKNPTGMRFQPRDGAILQALQDYDGMLSRRHIHYLFWPGKTERSMQRRLAKLYHAGYVDWPSRKDYQTKPVPEPVIWIGWRGALYLAGIQGIAVPPPKKENEYHLRKLEKALWKAGVRWVRTPRWSLLVHDLAVVDFRLAVLASLNQMESFSMRRWVNESYFRANLEVVEYNISLRNGIRRKMKKGVVPDGYFEILDEDLQQQGKSHLGRFLLEMDMSTHDNPSFGREKAAAGVAYVMQTLRGSHQKMDNLWWLIVTKGGKRRIKNLMRQTRKQAGEMANIFYFTNLYNLKNTNIFLDPIWSHISEDRKVSLFE